MRQRINVCCLLGIIFQTPGQGTSDGTFRNRKYFECPKDSGVFVGLDKLTPLEDSPENQNVKRKGGTVQASVTSFIKESLPSFRKGKNEQKSSMEMTEHGLESGQRVVVFIEDKPAKGIVRYIGDENGKKIVGLEMVSINFVDKCWYPCKGRGHNQKTIVSLLALIINIRPLADLSLICMVQGFVLSWG